MRTARRLQQRFLYSVQGEAVPVYERDADGNILYMTLSGTGEQIPIETGETTISYSEPVEMFGSLSFSGGEAEAKEYGLSISDYDNVLICQKDAYPITETSLIWYEEEPVYNSSGEVSPKSATFRVVAVKPSMGVSKYLLSKITK